MTNDALPSLSEYEKQRAFEWLRDEAMHIRHAYVALRSWAELKASPGEAEEVEHLRMQIGYIVTQLMLRGDTRTLPEIVEESAKATASQSDTNSESGGKHGQV